MLTKDEFKKIETALRLMNAPVSQGGIRLLKLPDVITLLKDYIQPDATIGGLPDPLLPPTEIEKIETTSDDVQCPKCKMVWKGAMGYVCPNNDCPIQPKVTC